ncbi:hypothetical protein [Streptomyces sp. NPDC048665]|uniref:hypothetical protein n=1 Tax=Streptomyces sp. NPDC048665 TaxID=3155490 RepID=UPI00342915A7
MYDDGLLACTDSELIIRRYYFPWGSAKRIPYSQIRGVQWIPLDLRTGSWRLWGSGDFVHYFNLDTSRPRKRVALIVDLGRRVKPVITPDEPERLVEVLNAHEITVTRS